MKGVGCVARLKERGTEYNFCKKNLGEREHLGELGIDIKHRTDVEEEGW
jgi:hypothetical protein